MKSFFLFCAIIALPFALRAQVATRVKNINPTGNSNAAGFTELNGKIYFAASDGVNGYELWSSDGTEAGTAMVKDINPNGDGLQTTIEFLKYNNKLIFCGNDGVTGKEIWETDGTAAGTRLIKDIRPNTAATVNTGFGPHSFTLCNNKVFFFANNGTTGMEPFVTDGTAAGTVLTKDIYSGSTSSVATTASKPVMVFQNKVYFLAKTLAYGDELWYSDGTAAGTQLLKDINPGAASIVFDAVAVPNAARISKNHIVHNDSLFISLDDGVHGRELWGTNGTTAGTIMLYDFTNLTPDCNDVSSHPSGFFINERGKVCFTISGNSSRNGLAVEMKKVANSYSFNNYILNICGMSHRDEVVFFNTDVDFISEGYLWLMSCAGTKNSKTIRYDYDNGIVPTRAGLLITNYYNSAFYHNQVFFAGQRIFPQTLDPVHLFRSTISKHAAPARDSSRLDSVANQLIIGKSLYQPTFGQANETLFFTATDVSGDIELYKIYTVPVATETTAEQSIAPLIVSPNPVAAGSVLSYTLPSNATQEPVRLLLYDVLGRLIIEQGQTASDKTLVLPANIPTGLYVLHIVQQNKPLANAKVIVK
jgi:ELWxxDGT repeat protein